MPLFPACTVPRCRGRMVKTFNDKALHTQLLFFKSLFDVEWAKAKVDADNKRRTEKLAVAPLAPEELAVFDTMKEHASRALGLSAFHTVDFPTLFAPVCQTIDAGSPERA